jgi:GTP-binding protein YchF
MGFRCGIVGLPNAGKSTLFNALTASSAAATAAYAFCTIEPNVGRIDMPDPRLEAIARVARSAKITPTQMDFVDIAGLVRGASRGEGLGNKFLAHIREVDAIAHVVRCFANQGVHRDGPVDPVADVEIVETELMLADLDSLERRLDGLAKKVRGGDKEAAALQKLAQRSLAVLREGRAAREIRRDADEEALFRQLQLLTAKPTMYVCNVEEDSAATGNDHSRRLEQWAKGRGAPVVVVAAAIEAEIAQIGDPADRAAFVAGLGLAEPGLNRVIRAGYELLGLQTFFTAGPKESRAWTIPKGMRAQDAAGRIHTDFARGFISAETIGYDDFIACGGEQAAREAAKMRREGRDYVVEDGDVILFRFNV